MVLITGFMHPRYPRTWRDAGKLDARVDPAAYVAMTRCTFHLVVAEVDARKFAQFVGKLPLQCPGCAAEPFTLTLA